MSFYALQYKVTKNIKFFVRILQGINNTYWEISTVFHIRVLIVLTLITDVLKPWSKVSNTYIYESMGCIVVS